MLDAIFFVRFSRHDLCPLFLPCTTERDRPPSRGPEEGRCRVRRVDLRSGRRPGHRKRFSRALPKAMDGGGPGASAADGAALCQEDYYIRLFDLFAMDPMFHAVFHACRGGHRPGRCLESDDRERARRTLHKNNA